MDPRIDRVADRIAAAERVVVLTGAGMSAESGVPTFRDSGRDPGGLWDRFDADEIGTAGGLLGFLISKPWEGIEFLKDLRDVFAAAQPHAGHIALTELQRAGRLDAIVTQNVDGLHQQAGSERIIELHGTFARRRCVLCGLREAVDRASLLDAFDRMIVKLGSYMVAHPAHLLDRCVCGGLFRPDFVAFGEAVQDLDAAVEAARSAEVMIVCGTSGVVYPAATLPGEARGAGAFLVEVNPDDTELSAVAHERLRGTAAGVLPGLAARVRQRLASVV